LPFPAGVVLTVPTKLWPMLRSPAMSWRGKLRLGLDLVKPARRDGADESLASFVRRRLGQEALDAVAEPLLAGVHVADPERLSLRATFPRLAEVESRHGSLIRGFRASAAEQRRLAKDGGPPGSEAADGPTRQLSPFVALRDGMQELVDALVNRAHGASIVRGQRVTRLDRSTSSSPDGETLRPGYRLYLGGGPSLAADAVVLPTPAGVSADLIEPFNQGLAVWLRQIRYVSTAAISLGYRRVDVTRPLNGSGFLVPRREARRLTACTWTSSKFDHRAPADHVLLRGFVGGVWDETIV